MTIPKARITRKEASKRMSKVFGEFRSASLMLLALAAIAAPACSSGPIGMIADAVGSGGDEKKEETAADAEEKENRISILAVDEVIEADPRFAGQELTLPPSYTNASWPTPGGEADHTLHHLSSAVTLQKEWTRDIGKAAQRSRLTSPPVVADGALYVMDAKATVSAIDTATGETKWEAELAPKLKEKFRVRDVLSRTKAGQVGFGGGVTYRERQIVRDLRFWFRRGARRGDRRGILALRDRGAGQNAADRLSRQRLFCHQRQRHDRARSGDGREEMEFPVV